MQLLHVHCLWDTRGGRQKKKKKWGGTWSAPANRRGAGEEIGPYVYREIHTERTDTKDIFWRSTSPVVFHVCHHVHRQTAMERIPDPSSWCSSLICPSDFLFSFFFWRPALGTPTPNSYTIEIRKKMMSLFSYLFSFFLTLLKYIPDWSDQSETTKAKQNKKWLLISYSMNVAL